MWAKVYPRSKELSKGIPAYFPAYCGLSLGRTFGFELLVDFIKLIKRKGRPELPTCPSFEPYTVFK